MLNKIRSKKGFTFIELVVAIAIIVVALAGSLLDAAATIGTSKTARAKDDVRQISLALTRYYVDNNAYPADITGLGNVVGGKGPWIKKVPTSDPWGHVWNYNSSTGSFSSSGPDGTPGNGDDITLSTL